MWLKINTLLILVPCCRCPYHAWKARKCRANILGIVKPNVSFCIFLPEVIYWCCFGIYLPSNPTDRSNLHPRNRQNWPFQWSPKYWNQNHYATKCPDQNLILNCRIFCLYIPICQSQNFQIIQVESLLFKMFSQMPI